MFKPQPWPTDYGKAVTALALDTAPSVSVPLARQPILDAQDGLVGYELLPERSREAREDDMVTMARVALGALTEVGLAAATGGAPAFLRVTGRFLLELDPLPFGPDGVVLALPAEGGADPGLLGRLLRLRESGYTIALDGLPPELDRIDLLDLAQVVRLDVEKLGARGITAARLSLRDWPGRLLAERVQTAEEHAGCLALHFDLFQGDFYCRPRPVGTSELPPGTLGHAQLAAVLARPDVDIDDLERAVISDVGLSFRLLRLVNSAAFTRGSQIANVRQAIVLLGPRTVRQWGMLLVLSEVAGRRVPLLTTGLVRARMCELIAGRLGATDAPSYFMAGLFSVLDALMDRTMDEVLSDLPMADDLVAALARRAGGKGRALSMAEACERADWASVEVPGLPGEDLAHLYADAVVWSDDVLRTAGG